ncbi:anaerobic ribonucleoside-triphosphate reductase activating protein [Candidatus Woesearchaeota archaeon]|nr:anaerobic ribonucleoside-triphosphate reductase activating protein [Candidatus Woesearchaeota archaeon]
MNIAGLQKFTLIDYPGKLACTIFLHGCNFRCGYCHNPKLVISHESKFLNKKEVLLFLKERKKYLDGVCITGGEALINTELPDFLKEIKKLDYKIKLDTNGSNPKLLQEIIDKKLIDYVAIDIKHSKEFYESITGININLNNIEKSIKIIAGSELDYELRTTVVPGYHDPQKINEISRWIYNLIEKKAKKYAIQNFVARKDGLIDKKFESIKSFSTEELEEIKRDIFDGFEEIVIRN